jgi:hypothetical protein
VIIVVHVVVFFLVVETLQNVKAVVRLFQRALLVHYDYEAYTHTHMHPLCVSHRSDWSQKVSKKASLPGQRKLQFPSKASSSQQH